MIGNTSTGGNRFCSSCGGQNIREQVYLYQQPLALLPSTNHPETTQPTLIHLRRGQCFRVGEDDPNDTEDRNWFNEVGCLHELEISQAT